MAQSNEYRSHLIEAFNATIYLYMILPVLPPQELLKLTRDAKKILLYFSQHKILVQKYY